MMEYVNESPTSASAVVNVPASVPTAEFSAIVELLKLTSVGASFTPVTVTVDALSNVSPPLSVVRTVTDSVGVASKSTVPDPTCNLSPAIWNAADTSCVMMEYVNESPTSASVVVNVPTSVPTAEFSAIVELLKLDSVGASFTPVNVPTSVPT